MTQVKRTDNTSSGAQDSTPHPGQNSQVTAVGAQTYDDIYTESWTATIDACKEKLDDVDYKHALHVRDIHTFREELSRLRDKHPGGAQRHVIGLLYPALENYDQFVISFVKTMEQTVEASMLWGLLYLVVNLSLESKGTINRVSRMLEQIGYKLKRLNLCTQSFSDYSQSKGDVVKIIREMILLWLNLIMTFRKLEYDIEPDVTWGVIQGIYDEAMQNIGDAVIRVEILAEAFDRQVRLMDLETFIRLPKEGQYRDMAKQFPCHTLPVAGNKNFFGRKDILAQIEAHLQTSESSRSLKSLALHGLGGVGKTQVALAYGYYKLGEVDAIFWLPAEKPLAFLQGFSKIAIEALQLEGAQLEAHHENMLLVMEWFQRTDRTWVLIFDNVESHSIFNDCWPVSGRGSIVVTTRSHGVASQPIDLGIEIKEFSIDDGAEFLLMLCSRRNVSETENQYATEISTLLKGFALAINQMAAYINARAMSFERFVRIYRNYPEKLHRDKRPGWKNLGYDHTVNTVWDISFGTLDEAALSCITVEKIATLPVNLMFCEDELKFGDATEQLTTTALVRYDPSSQKFVVHRLVQQECLFRANEADRQAAFDATIELLLDKFPQRGSMVTMDHLWEKGDKYLLQIGVVANHWYDSQPRLEPLLPSVNFCNLMADAAWFVHDNDTAGIMSLVINCASEAYKKLPEQQKDRLIYCDILELLSTRDLMMGVYDSARDLSHSAIAMRLDMGLPEDLKMANCYNGLALSLDSLEEHEEARLWLEKSAAILKRGDDDLHTRLSCQNNLNSARNLYCVGDFDAAEEKLDRSLQQATQFNSWYSLGYVHETYASLHSRRDDLDKAWHHIILARAILDGAGRLASISWISGLCTYRAASIAIRQGRIAVAIDEAEKAVAFGRLHKAPTHWRARSTHILSKALSMDPKRAKDADRAREDAQHLRRLLPHGQSDLSDESDHAYEILVNIVQR